VELKGIFFGGERRVICLKGKAGGGKGLKGRHRGSRRVLGGVRSLHVQRKSVHDKAILIRTTGQASFSENRNDRKEPSNSLPVKGGGEERRKGFSGEENDLSPGRTPSPSRQNNPPSICMGRSSI